MERVRIAVVGSGVIGLSSALAILERHPKANLTVFYDKKIEDTTSFGPPAIFRPAIDGDKPLIRKWARTSFARMSDLWMHSNVAESGAQMLSGYILSNDTNWLKQQEDLYGDIVFNFHSLTAAEQAPFNKKFNHGIFFTTYTLEGQKHVFWLRSRVEGFGAKFVKKRIERFTDLAGKFDVVLNCSGLEARQLTHDHDVHAIRGILLQVKAPWLKHFVYAGNDSVFFAPAQDTVFIGTTRDPNNESLTIQPGEREKILERCSEVIPAIKGCPIVKEWVGLRPGRSKVRLEKEVITSADGKSLIVIHNYGHGGNGFTLGWGCALDVLEMLEQSCQSATAKL